jgi:hypothetical protein
VGVVGKGELRDNCKETPSLEEFPEAFGGYLSSVQDLLLCAGFDDVLARNDNDMFIVGHGNVLTFSKNVKPCTLEGSRRVHERPAEAWSYCDFDSPQLF